MVYLKEMMLLLKPQQKASQAHLSMQWTIDLGSAVACTWDEELW